MPGDNTGKARLDPRRLAVCTSVHAEWDPRIAFREAAALSSDYDVHLYVNDTGREAGQDTAGPWTLHKFERPGNRISRAMSGRRLVEQAVRDGAGTVIAHDPELLLWLVWSAGRKGAVTVYDVHEDYASMTAHKSWLPAWLRPLAGPIIRFAEKSLGRSIDVFLVADSHLASVFSEYDPVLVRNYPPAGTFRPGAPASSRPPSIVYVGGITAERGASEMLEALRKVRESVPEAELTVIGRAPHGEAAEMFAAEPGVHLLGEQPYPAIAEHLASARVGLALLRDTPKHRRNVPSKLFDYMACGTPFVATDLPNIREATEGLGGVFVPTDDVEAASAAIVQLLTDDTLADRLGDEGAAAADEAFSFTHEAARMIERLQEKHA